MVKTIKLRDNCYPGQRVETLKSAVSCNLKPEGDDQSYGKELASTDVTLHCGTSGKTIRAHKLVLASISDFMKLCLIENEKQEEDSGIHIILDDMEYEVLKIIIDFAYSGETRVKTTIVDRICEASHRLQIKYLKDSFVKMNRKEFEEMKANKSLNSEDKKMSDQTIVNENSSSGDVSLKPKSDQIVGSKRKVDKSGKEKDGPIRKAAKTQEIEKSKSEEPIQTPRIVRYQRPIVPANSAIVFREVSPQSGKIQTVRSASPLKPILPATPSTSSNSKTNKLSSPISVKTKKVIHSSAPTTPRKVLPKSPTLSNVVASDSGPLLVGPGGKLLRLVSQSPLQSTNQPLLLQKIRRQDGTIVQVLKQTNLATTQHIKRTVVLPKVIDGNLVQSSSNQSNKIVLGSPTLPNTQHSRIVKGGSITSDQSQSIPSLKNRTNLGTLTSSIHPPKIIKLSTNNMTNQYNSKIMIKKGSGPIGEVGENINSPILLPKSNSQPRIVIQPKSSGIRGLGSPRQPIKIQKLSTQMSQVEENQRHLVKAVSGITEVVKKITGACVQEHSIPSVSSLKPGIPITLPDDFLDTGDSDSDKPPPLPDQKLDSSSEKNMKEKTGTKENQSSQNSSTTSEGKSSRSSSRQKMIVSSSKEEIENEKTEIIGRTRQKRVTKEDPKKEVPTKKSSRSDSKLQNAVTETNTKSTRLSSVQKPKMVSNKANKNESKPGLRSSARKR